LVWVGAVYWTCYRWFCFWYELATILILDHAISIILNPERYHILLGQISYLIGQVLGCYIRCVSSSLKVLLCIVWSWCVRYSAIVLFYLLESSFYLRHSITQEGWSLMKLICAIEMFVFDLGLIQIILC
jgi:hypothetical protein